MASYAQSVPQGIGDRKQLTYTSYDYDVTVLPFSHHRQDGFDDVDVGKEVDLEDLVH